MKGKTTICIRIDTELKNQAEELFGKLGMNLTTAVTIFVRQSVREGRIPFEVGLEIKNNEQYSEKGMR